MYVPNAICPGSADYSIALYLSVEEVRLWDHRLRRVLLILSQHSSRVCITIQVLYCHRKGMSRLSLARIPMVAAAAKATITRSNIHTSTSKQTYNYCNTTSSACL